MLTLDEIADMNKALDAYRGFMAATNAEASKTGFLYPRAVSAGFFVDAIGWVFNEAIFQTGGRAQEIVDEQEANLAKFIDRRNELIEMDPSDHEAVLSFVEALYRIAQSPLPQAMAAERASSSLEAIAGGAAADTAGDIKKAFDWLPIVLVAVAGLYILVIVKR